MMMMNSFFFFFKKFFRALDKLSSYRFEEVGCAFE